MHCRLLTQYAIIMVQFLAGLRKIKLLAARRFDALMVILLQLRKLHLPLRDDQAASCQ